MKPHFLFVIAAFGHVCASAHTAIDHSALAYFVPGKRITVNAGVTDPKGVKVARTYFRAGAQADYTYVPMTYTSGNRYVAMLPAPSEGTPWIEYLVLAQNNEGSVSRTPSYTMPARSSGDAPSWQSTASRGDVKVFTELTQAPASVSGFTDSITLDVAESGARLGAVAGLYGAGGAGGAAGATSASSSGASATTATTASSTTATAAGTTAASTGAAAGGTAAATAGGLSTAAIIGGVAVAGAAAAAAASSGGGGGSSSPPPATTNHPFAGTWTGTVTSPETFTCSGPGFPTQTTSCTSTQPFTAIIDPSGNLTINLGTGTDVCNSSSNTLPPQTISGGVVSTSGVATVIPPVDSGGTVDVCTPVTIQFSLSPRRVTGSGTCTVQSNTPGVTCTGGGTTTITGS